MFSSFSFFLLLSPRKGEGSSNLLRDILADERRTPVCPYVNRIRTFAPVSGPAVPAGELEHTLHPTDLADLRRSGLNDLTIQKMGVFSLSREQIEDRLGVRVESAGYAIPYQGIEDQTGQTYLRVRLQVPLKKQKYCGGKGDEPELYVPSGLYDLPAEKLLVVAEGEKKAAKAVQGGIACVAVQGVWSWGDPDHRLHERSEQLKASAETLPLQSLITMAKSFPRVLVLGDSDLLQSGKEVAASGFRILAEALRRLGINAYMATCPPHYDVEEGELSKVGLDDWLIKESAASVRRKLELSFAAAQANTEGLPEPILAKNFAAMNSHRLAFSPGRGWMRYDGPKWGSDETQEVRKNFVEEFRQHSRATAEALNRFKCETLSACGNSVPQPDCFVTWASSIDRATKQIRTGSARLEKHAGIENVLDLAKAYSVVEDKIWDSDPYLLCASNGVVDLRTGTVSPSAAGKYMTRSTGAAFRPDAVAPRWAAFLEQVQPDPEVREYLQRLAGYATTGLNGEQLAFFHVGGGANGKSTFWHCVSKVLGEYAVTATPALVDGRAETREQLYELAELVGARLVNIGETERGTKLASAMVKRITGGEAVTARFPNGRRFSYEPACTLNISTNHMPETEDPSLGARRRVEVLRWDVTIPKHERDPMLMGRLLDEAEGILLWLVEGSRMYFRDGLRPPSQMIKAVEDLATSGDEVQQWLDLNVECDDSFEQQSKPLYDNYVLWAQEQGFTPKRIQEWAQDLGRRGYQKGKNSDSLVEWKGLRLRLPGAGRSGASITPTSSTRPLEDRQTGSDASRSA